MSLTYFSRLASLDIPYHTLTDKNIQLAKMLKYLQFRLLCDIVFGMFMIVWFVTRHVFYFMVLWSLHTENPEEIKDGCYWGPTNDLQGPIDPPDKFGHLIQPFLNPVGLVCWNPNIRWSFMITLLGLQVILLLWFVMIIRVAVKVVQGGEAEDSRSDDEDSDEEEVDHHPQEKYTNNHYLASAPFEEDVDAGAITYRRTSPPRKFRKAGGAASGVTLPSDRKELLGRIGCDKGAS